MKHRHCIEMHEKQECIPVGCIPSAAVVVLWRGGVCLRGVCPGEVSAQWGCLPGGCLPGGGVGLGVSVWGVCPGGYLPRRVVSAQEGCELPPPPHCGQNDRCLRKHYLSATTGAVQCITGLSSNG